jgi:hypothetical protein
MSSDGYQPIHYSSAWRQSVRGLFDGNGIALYNTETDPGNGVRYQSTQEFTTSYRVVAVSPAYANHFCILGQARDGSSIIERWTALVGDGGYDAVRDQGGPTRSYITGTTFVPPSQRPLVQMDRQEIYRGNDYGTLIAINADPDNRYVLAIGRPGSGAQLIRFDTESFAADVVTTSSSIPVLSQMDTFETVYHLTEGMLHIAFCTATTPAVGDRVIMYDTDLDGAIDSIVHMTQQAFDAAGYHDKSSWREDLIAY